MRVSRRAGQATESMTMAVRNRALRLKAQGVDVVSFSVGEPDFDTPEHIKAAAARAIRDGRTGYPPSQGIEPLRRAVADRFAADGGLDYSPDVVLVSNGAKHAIHNALAAVCDPGDQVIVPRPYWLSYPDMCLLVGAECTFVDTPERNGFKLTGDALREAITPATKALILNSPNNPTGAVYTRDEYRELAEVVVENNLVVISDEVYEDLVFPPAEFVRFATVHPGLPERTVTTSGVSKSYAMCGWRIGYAVGPDDILQAMYRIQSQQTSGACHVSQYAALAALTGDQAPVATMRAAYARRRRLVLDRLAAMPNVTCAVPDGTFYAFMNVSAMYGRRTGATRIVDSASFCEASLADAHVALAPGAAFGADDYVRLSFATGERELQVGLERLARFVGG